MNAFLMKEVIKVNFLLIIYYIFFRIWSKCAKSVMHKQFSSSVSFVFAFNYRKRQNNNSEFIANLESFQIVLKLFLNLPAIS